MVLIGHKNMVNCLRSFLGVVMHNSQPHSKKLIGLDEDDDTTKYMTLSNKKLTK